MFGQLGHSVFQICKLVFLSLLVFPSVILSKFSNSLIIFLSPFNRVNGGKEGMFVISWISIDKFVLSLVGYKKGVLLLGMYKQGKQRFLDNLGLFESYPFLLESEFTLARLQNLSFVSGFSFVSVKTSTFFLTNLKTQNPVVHFSSSFRMHTKYSLSL